ncbi:MAG: ferredoxin--NADP reductase [Planctomycetes bacterium]|nr:ferredoxin--NADP reductase [Planctomycetota bacterium]
MGEDIFNATIVDRRDLTPELAIIRVRHDTGTVPEFEPGQFCTLGLPKEEPADAPATEGPARRGPRMDRRSYSIATPPSVRDHYELLVVLVPTGKLTPRLWTMEAGSRLWMQERADGMFTLKPIPEGKDLVMVATGTGIGPYISILRAYRDARPRRWRRLVLIHGTRLAVDQAYREELEAITAQDESVRYIPVVSREPIDSQWKGLRGHVQAALEPAVFETLAGAKLDPAEAHVFLCGNPAMVTDAQALLEGRGFVADKMRGPMGNIHVERYW